MATLAFATEQHPAPTPPERRAAVLQDPGFGRVFTDHMVAIRYREGKGWHDAKITARVAIPMDPAAAVLHYSQQIFEGLKAYRTADGGAVMFRPEANARRFQKSAERLAMPMLPEDAFVTACDELVKIDRDWIPEGDGSLYLRPVMFASEVFLGVKPSSEYLFLVILRITKQSLNRVLGQLVRRGFIIQHRGPQDRRQRLLELTERGRELERQLSELQRIRVAGAYRKAGPQAVEGFRKVLLGIIAGDDDRRRFDRRAARS